MRYSVPGVYIETEKVVSNEIKLTDKKVAGFLGLAEKGPLHKAVRIKSFSQFEEIFGGFTDYSYLAYAIYGFFSIGGNECVIVRVAHSDENDPDNSANKAELPLNNVNGKHFAKIIARSEGSWGNKIEIKIQHVNAFSSVVKQCVQDERPWIEIDRNNALGEFKTGDSICLRGEHTFLYNRIEEVTEDKIYLTNKINKTFLSKNTKITCENIRLNINVINGKEYEDFLYLSPNKSDDRYFIDIVNDESILVKIEVENRKNDFLVEQVNYSNLQKGTDGIVSLNPGDFIGYYKGFEDYKGFGIFEEFEDVHLLVSPDIMVFEDIVYNNYKDAREAIFKVQKAMIDQCERLGDRFAILDAPKTEGVLDLMNWSKKFDSGFAAMYYPKIEIINPEDSSGLTSLFTPPSGHVAGVYVTCDMEEGMHRAPANKLIRGAVGLETQILNEEIEFLYPRGINCMKYTPGMGIKIWGARTLSSDPSWRYINIRRVFSVIKESIKTYTGWAVFEPNDIKLRKRLVRHITAFLIDLWRKGYLTGKTVEEAFFVRCDDELNYPEEIEAGRINVEIGIALSKPAEFLMVKLRASSDDQAIIMDE